MKEFLTSLYLEYGDRKFEWVDGYLMTNAYDGEFIKRGELIDASQWDYRYYYTITPKALELIKNG